jgi:hypothetical protein
MANTNSKAVPEPVKVRFTKESTYGDTWTGYVGANAVFTIRRNYNYGKGYCYTLYRFGGNMERLDSSCFLQDVMRRAREMAR